MANIVLRLSTGSTSSSTSNGGTNSLGGKMGTDAAAVITTSNTTLNNIFDDITKSQNAAGTYDYRCVFIHNNTSDVAQTFSGGELFVNGSPLAEFSFSVAGAKKLAVKLLHGDQEYLFKLMQIQHRQQLLNMLLLAVQQLV